MQRLCSNQDYGQLDIRPLSEQLGAEIVGLDVRQPMSSTTIDAIRKVWHDHLVIVLRNQQLATEDQLRFCSYFGDIGKRLSVSSARREPGGLPEGAMYISNIKENGQNIGYLPDGEMEFHIDMCYVERPHAGAALFAIEIPSVGGDTMFSNLYSVYDSLPDEMKRKLAGLTATHYYDGEVLRRADNKSPEKSKHFTHPVIRTHPETGRKSVYVSRLMTARIEELDDNESDEILTYLFAQIEKAEFVYKHVWRKGDLLMWDNRCTAHARTDFDPNERRHLTRVVLQGDRPC